MVSKKDAASKNFALRKFLKKNLQNVTAFVTDGCYTHVMKTVIANFGTPDYSGERSHQHRN